MKPGRRAWYVEGYYGVGRLFGHLFRLSWYGSGPGVRVKCEGCDGQGSVILPDMRPAYQPHVNAIPHRDCAGLGSVWKTDGVL